MCGPSQLVSVSVAVDRALWLADDTWCIWSFHCFCIYFSLSNPAHTLERSGSMVARVFDLRQRGCGFEPHRRHYAVALSKTVILALTRPDTTENC